MPKRRTLYGVLFWTGTLLAGLGWYAEWRLMDVDLSLFVMLGHLLQLVGILGYMLTPDATVRLKELEEHEV